MTKLEPLWNRKAISFDNTMIIADLHVGYERELENRGINLPSQTKAMSKEIEDMLKDGNYDQIIINGDLKHNIPSGSWQEYKEIPRLIDVCLSFVDCVHLVPGNHDGGIQQYLPSEVKIHEASGFVIDDIGVLHGHANPSEDVLKARSIVIAHSHPTVSLIDSLGQKNKMQCWIKMEFEYNGYNGDIVLMPHFNNLMGGISVNENGYLGPLLKNSDLKNEQVHLLDGTYLGTMDKIKSLQDRMGVSYLSKIE
ncbi:MAG: metallophosphoesterase [Candidatus Saliniplasma sp.]